LEKAEDEVIKYLTTNETSLRIRTALRAERAGYFSEVTKALVAVNSGGVVTILTTMGSLARTGYLTNFKSFGCLGLMCFSVGMVAAMFVPIALADHVAAVREKKGNAKKWVSGAAKILGLSFAALIFGLSTVTLGAFQSF